MEWFVYIAQARTGKYYTGITNNPAERLKKHNSGHGAQMAKSQGPFVFVYCSSPFPNKSEARKREVQVKGLSVEKKRKLIDGEWR